ncbi:MAG: 50S ribosomal protein L19 [Deltaproteobacteria bacterium]|nr:50S ribosomal protein L19 [Deltaproteobacteria bacterium]
MSRKLKNKDALLKQFESRQMKKVPALKVGNTVRIYAKIKEGDKERVQQFEGVLMRFAKGGLRSTMTVRKVSFGIGVERIFPLHSPTIERIEKVSEGRVRRARLYYLRKRHGRAARIEEAWREEDGEHVVETMGTVATGPVISSSETPILEKKTSILETADSQKKS